MTIERQKVGDDWIELTTKSFEPGVPELVFMEVRQNMRRDGWQYRGTTEIEVGGVAVMVQHYQRPATEPAEEVES